MSLYQRLQMAGVEADLTKNEAKIWAVFLVKTLNFGKTSDNMTDKHWQKLTGIKMDRMRTALKGVVEKGLIDAEEAYEYDYCYSIPEKFLKSAEPIFTPHNLYPNNRRAGLLLKISGLTGATSL